jgi:hypothetical protein
MAKIIKVGSQAVTPNKIANPFRTSRTSTTNPFKYNNFEGNTLPFEIAADVFTTTKKGNTNRFKMIASSVTGSMNKMKSNIAEPIVNFVKRVRENVSSAWAYAKNTNISDIPVIKKANEVLNTPIHVPALDKATEILNKPIRIEALDIMASKMANVKEGVASKMGVLNKDVMDVTKDLATKWEATIAKVSFQGKQKYSTMSVSELENAWKEIDALEGGIA